MKVTLLEKNDKYTVVGLSGSLGVEAAQKIESDFKRYTSGLHRSTIVDLAEVSLITSFGIRLFLDVMQSLEKEGKKLVLIRPQQEVKEVLIACEMDTLAGIYDTKEAAVAAL